MLSRTYISAPAYLQEPALSIPLPQPTGSFQATVNLSIQAGLPSHIPHSSQDPHLTHRCVLSVRPTSFQVGRFQPFSHPTHTSFAPTCSVCIRHRTNKGSPRACSDLMANTQTTWEIRQMSPLQNLTSPVDMFTNENYLDEPRDINI